MPHTFGNHLEFLFLLELKHVNEKALEAALSFVREAAAPAQMVNHDRRIGLKHVLPQRLDQWTREKRSAHRDVVLSKYLNRDQLDLVVKELDKWQRNLLRLHAFEYRRVEQESQHCVRLLILQFVREYSFSELHDVPHDLFGTLVTEVLGQSHLLERFAKERAELAQERFVESVLLDALVVAE